MSPRKLSDEEHELWVRLRRSVRPLRRARREIVAEAAIVPAVADTPQRSAALIPAARPAAPVTRVPPPLVPLEARDRRRLSRGISEVDARIDLHGMSQERAFSALIGFLRSAQARGHRTVLVITGKGRGDPARGVLRAAVPEWLSRPDIRPLVLGMEEAGRRHGGGGALYVRLRRRS